MHTSEPQGPELQILERMFGSYVRSHVVCRDVKVETTQLENHWYIEKLPVKVRVGFFARPRARAKRGTPGADTHARG